MHDLYEKGEYLILGGFEKAKGLKVNLWGMLRGIFKSSNKIKQH